MPTTTTKPVGAVVSVDDDRYPGLWRVIKVNPKNTDLEPVDAEGNLRAGRKMRIPHAYVADAADAADATPGAVGVPYREPLAPGTLVTTDSERINAGVPAHPRIGKPVFVVLADKGDARVRIVRLGGDGGRSWRTAPRGLTVVDPEEVVAA